MMDSGSDGHEEMAGEGPEQPAIPPQAQPEVNGDQQEAEPEEERTLTDHLNKKLLESFLNELDSGDVQFPPGIYIPMGLRRTRTMSLTTEGNGVILSIPPRQSHHIFVIMAEIHVPALAKNNE